MDAPANHDSPFAHGTQCSGDQRAIRCEDNCGIQKFARSTSRVTDPNGVQAPREVLRGKISRTSEGICLDAPPSCYLGNNMRRRAEPIDTQPLNIFTTHAQ